MPVAAAVVGVFAAVVSAAGSWIPSLWGDEAASVLSALRPGGSLLAMLTHVDAVHGAYYLGLHEWVQVFGASPFAVRLPSAFAIGVCAAGVTWLCGRFGPLAFAVSAGVIAAVLPRLTYAGEEARGYAFSAALATLVWIVVVELLRHGVPTRRGWALYAAVLTLGIYVFLYLALLTIAVGVVLAMRGQGRRHLRHWAVASAVAIVAATPVVVLAVTERRQVAFLAHREVTASTVLVKMWFTAWPFAVIAWALILTAVVWWLADAVRRRRRGERAGLDIEALAVAWLAVPTGILLAASAVVAGYTPRYGTFAAPAAAVLMAVGVRRLAGIRLPSWMPRVTLAALALVAVLVAAGPVWTGQRTPWAKNKSDWNDIAATIQQSALPGDAIVFDDSVRPSRRPRLALDTDPAAFAGLADVTLETSYADSTSWYASVYSVAEAARLGRFAGVDRVWVVEYARDGGAPDSDAVADLEALGYEEADSVRLHSSMVLLFTR